MLFLQILNEITVALQPEFDRLHLDAWSNQTHTGDLLLVSENGFYHEEVHKWNNLPKKQSPYVIGPGVEGHSERAHNDFIGTYLKRNLSEENNKEYLERIKYTADFNPERDILLKEDEYLVQQEMLIYQKIWEMDSFIKKFYQLTRLVLGDPYEWHFKIKQSTQNTDKGLKRSAILTKLVQDRLKPYYPVISNIIQDSYISQIRNSIAHSRYSIHGRFIHLNNHIEGDAHSQLQVLSFEEWSNIIHNTIVLYTQINRLLNKVDQIYWEMARKTDEKVEVRINRKDPRSSTEYHLLKRRSEIGGWYWASNDETLN
ncbi:hypothetical protein [Paraflavitalea pollutisoli]|uniref:hypothetical protein n=1 Tax=Paraflavitalea pollutisoli TaxID=3034143 RepID=UPI0023EBE8BF|nr:hypothetical protein [Paraflavitalea sp. H1-2-19X]